MGGRRDGLWVDALLRATASWADGCSVASLDLCGWEALRSAAGWKGFGWCWLLDGGVGRAGGGVQWVYRRQRGTFDGVQHRAQDNGFFWSAGSGFHGKLLSQQLPTPLRCCLIRGPLDHLYRILNNFLQQECVDALPSPVDKNVSTPWPRPAGKSSLLNALLGEESILPTNGMRACTARCGTHY